MRKVVDYGDDYDGERADEGAFVSFRADQRETLRHVPPEYGETYEKSVGEIPFWKTGSGGKVASYERHHGQCGKGKPCKRCFGYGEEMRGLQKLHRAEIRAPDGSDKEQERARREIGEQGLGRFILGGLWLLWVCGKIEVGEIRKGWRLGFRRKCDCDRRVICALPFPESMLMQVSRGGKK